MAELKSGATLGELQEYIRVHLRERGFDKQTALQDLLLLTEEVGELAKAIRRDKAVSGMGIDPNSQVGDIAHEIADVVWMATALANLYGIDLEDAIRDKEVINHARIWK